MEEIKYFSLYSKAQHLTLRPLLKEGVPLMAGTDANVPVMVLGFSMQQEMKTLNELGMNNAQVLASATTIPAKWAGSNTGKITPGYKANLVLLSANPLEKIDHTKSIQSVIKDGRILTRSDLDTILHLVKQANDFSREISLDPYH